MVKLVPVFLLLLWFVSYVQMVGNLQMDYDLEEPCFMSASPDAFDVAWPAASTLLPVAGQLVAFGWAASLAITHGSWPQPQLKINYEKAQIMCAESIQ